MIRSLAGLILLVVLSGCGGVAEGEKVDEEEGPEPSVVGEIASVHAEKGFVLVKRYGPGELPGEGIFSARSAGGVRAVGLEPTGEKLGRFYAADFSRDAGLPRKGDLVVVEQLRGAGGSAGDSEEDLGLEGP
ncbi:MAG: hypothetical protein AAGC74_09590 [Verrucomicrobiota bacterium]